jgi:FkbM family methyltransferase
VFEADPALADVARHTAEANGFSPSVTNAVLLSAPADDSVDFFVHEDFWASSLRPDDHARRVRVPTASFTEAMSRFTPTYLTVDIEGGEVELLSAPLPAHVRAICLEVHPGVAGVTETRTMFGRLIADGFALDTKISRDDSVFFER